MHAYINCIVQIDDQGATLHLADFLVSNESWQAYLQRMKKSKQWGGHIELVATANLFGVTICVITDREQEPFDIRIQPKPDSIESDDVLLLGFNSMTKHYYSLQGK